MITFPTTPDEFISYQETGAGRRLTNGEKEVLVLAVELLNQCYEIGKAGGPIFWEHNNKNSASAPAVNRFFASMQYWQQRAYEQGMEDAKHE